MATKTMRMAAVFYAALMSEMCLIMSNPIKLEVTIGGASQVENGTEEIFGGNHNFNLSHLEIDLRYGIRPIRSYGRTIHLQNPHQSTFLTLTMTIRETKKMGQHDNSTMSL